MLLLIALLLSPPPAIEAAEAAFAIADVPGPQRVRLLAEFATRWPKPPLGPKAFANAWAAPRIATDRDALARAALTLQRWDAALELVGAARDRASSPLRKALACALADVGRLPDALRLAADPVVASALTVDRQRADDVPGALAAAFAAPTERGARFRLLLQHINRLAPAQRPDLLGALAAGFMLLGPIDARLAASAWDPAVKRLADPHDRVSRVKALRPLPAWGIGPIEDPATLRAELQATEPYEHEGLHLALVEIALSAGQPAEARTHLLAAWNSHLAHVTREDDDGLAPYVIGWAQLGDWPRVKRIARQMTDPGESLQAAMEIAFMRGEPQVLLDLVPVWLPARSVKCAPDETDLDAFKAIVEIADTAGLARLIDTATARISSPLLANAVRLARIESATDRDDLHRAVALFEQLDATCPSDRAARHAAWPVVLHTLLEADRLRLAWRLVQRMLTRGVPVEDWPALVDAMHTAGLGPALANQVKTLGAPIRTAWLEAVLAGEDKGILEVRDALRPLTPDQAGQVQAAHAAVPTLAPRPADPAERLDWLIEAADRAVEHHQPGATALLAEAQQALMTRTDAEGWAAWIDLSFQATPPCLRDPCATPSAVTALTRIADVRTRVAAFTALLKLLARQPRIEWIAATITALRQHPLDDRCATWRAIDDLMQPLIAIDPHAATPLIDQLPPPLRAAALRARIEHWQTHYQIDDAWADLKRLVPGPGELPCALPARPDRAALLRTQVDDIIEGRRLDRLAPALDLAGDAARSATWAPLWPRLVDQIFETGQVPALRDVVDRFNPPHPGLESALTRAWLAKGHLRLAIRHARAPVTRMRLLLAIARHHRAIPPAQWRSLSP